MCKHEITYQYPDYKDIKNICTEIEDEHVHMPAGRKFYEVQSFEKLIELVAHLRFCNREQLLLFRGQNKLYMNRNGAYSFYPSIFRGEQDDELVPLRPGKLAERYSKLQDIHESLKNYLPLDYQDNALVYGIIQHYKLTETPVLDLTRSLQVAFSFGRDFKGKAMDCYIAIFGYPLLQGNQILYRKKPNIINIPLLSFCPPEFLRPHFQEAHAVCLNIITYKNKDKCRHDQRKNLVAIVKLKYNRSDTKYQLDKKYLRLYEEPNIIKQFKNNYN